MIEVQVVGNSLIITESWSGYEYSNSSKKSIIKWLQKRIERFEKKNNKDEEDIKKMKDLLNLNCGLVEWITQADIYLQSVEKKKKYICKISENGHSRVIVVQEDMLATVILRPTSGPITSKVYITGGPIIAGKANFPNVERI